MQWPQNSHDNRSRGEGDVQGGRVLFYQIMRLINKNLCQDARRQFMTSCPSPALLYSQGCMSGATFPLILPAEFWLDFQ